MKRRWTFIDVADAIVFAWLGLMGVGGMVGVLWLTFGK